MSELIVREYLSHEELELLGDAVRFVQVTVVPELVPVAKRLVSLELLIPYPVYSAGCHFEVTAKGRHTYVARMRKEGTVPLSTETAPEDDLNERDLPDSVAVVTIRTKNGTVAATLANFCLHESRSLTPIFEVGQEKPGYFKTSPTLMHLSGTVLDRTEDK